MLIMALDYLVPSIVSVQMQIKIFIHFSTGAGIRRSKYNVGKHAQSSNREAGNYKNVTTIQGISWQR